MWHTLLNIVDIPRPIPTSSRRIGDTPSAQRIDLGALVVDLRTHEVAVDGELVELTPKEFDLLAHLAADPGAVLNRRDILEEVWDVNWYGSPKTLDVHVKRLRAKVEIDPAEPQLLVTVRGLGYKFEA